MVGGVKASDGSWITADEKIDGGPSVVFDAVEQGKKGELKIESIAFKDAIPKDFGRALGVTVRPENPDVAQLWFEKADGTIVLINVDSKHGRLGEKILVIPRS